MTGHLRRAAATTALLALPQLSSPALEADGPRGAELVVLATAPARHQGHVPRAAAVSVTFDRPLLASSIHSGSFRVFGRSSGTAAGPFNFSNGDRTVTLTPARPFAPGEVVLVNLAHTIRAADGTPLRGAGYAFQFTAAAGRFVPGRVDPTGRRRFSLMQTLLVRTTPTATTRAYGGLASDFDRDGWLDLAIINEDSADVRVFMNRADGSGQYEPFLQPPTPVGRVASPNEPGDFDNDGLPDAATANVSDGTVSILLGRGDGTFEPQQVVPVGATPRGLAILDVDGDADLDLVAANYSGNSLSRLLNDGSGVFGPAVSFDSGGNGEYGLGAADMDNDGVYDLVVATRNDQTIHVLRGNGDGTFTRVSGRPSGGATWMLALGDVDGDRHMDVSAANSQSNNGAILRGNGDGTLDPAEVVPTAGFPLATDLGDLDNDGDLDWVLSTYFGARWHLFVNDGRGGMSAGPVFIAPEAASCAVFLDFDNDFDLDLALVDEEADVVLLMRNGR